MSRSFGSITQFYHKENIDIQFFILFFKEMYIYIIYILFCNIVVFNYFKKICGNIKKFISKTI